MNLNTDDPQKISENDAKMTWDVSVGLSDEVNKNVADDLLVYLRGQSESAFVPTKELCGMIVNNYYNCMANSKLSLEGKLAKKEANRRGNRKTDVALQETEENICQTQGRLIEKFGRDYSGVFYRDVMSDDESDTDTTVTVLRPSWRSDELNEFFDFLDTLAISDLGKRAGQLKARHHVVVSKAIPRGLVAKMPAWTKRE
ncbi:hypothetical protein INT47_009237 [Mucor saturninus]|uniref:Uncharacterized protein n=1 Tax=Mucor saturninus TaxID=64648 RepID=A0A8H7USN8_9FUNG|nr:hypothetical protein INT47_009237 [Mucor saturninus]